MKLFIQAEPELSKKLWPKRHKRRSYKWLKKARNRAVRRVLNRDLDVDSNIIKRVRDWEF